VGGAHRDVPVWNLATSGTLSAFTFNASMIHPRGARQFSQLMDVAVRFLDRADAVKGPVSRAWLTDTAAFLLAVAGTVIAFDDASGSYRLVDRHYVEDDDTGDFEERIELGEEVSVERARAAVLRLAPFLATRATRTARIGLLGYFSPEEASANDLLGQFRDVEGFSSTGIGAPRDRLADFVMNAWPASVDSENRVSLALCLDTRSTVARLRKGENVKSGDDGPMGLAQAVQVVARATPDSTYTGAVDPALRRLLSPETGPWADPSHADAFRVLELAEHLPFAQRQALIARAIQLTLGWDAIAAAELAERQSRSTSH
jgi:hypothetical protein